MISIPLELLKEYRSKTYHTLPGLRVHSARQALDFVNERGFVFFWPITGVLLPSLWMAAAGDRPVPNEHDDPGHVTWDWKDSMLDKREWYYARLLRRRNVILSLEMLPNFYALSPNYGDPENDYLEQYRQGVLTAEARAVYEALLTRGPLDSLELRKQSHLAGSESQARFSRALDDLQIEMKILPTGVAHTGRWNYAFIYDIVPRHFQDLMERARPIGENQARQEILQCYLHSVGACQTRDVQRLFNWKTELAERVIKELVESGSLLANCTLEGHKGEWLALPALQ